jgi:hypothetical protein
MSDDPTTPVTVTADPPTDLAVSMAKAKQHVERLSLAYAEGHPTFSVTDESVMVTGEGEPGVIDVPEMSDADVSALIDAAESPSAPPELRPVRLSRRRLWGSRPFAPTDGDVPNEMPGALMVEPAVASPDAGPRPYPEQLRWSDDFVRLAEAVHADSLAMSHRTFLAGALREAGDTAAAAVQLIVAPAVGKFWEGAVGLRLVKLRQRLAQLRDTSAAAQAQLTEARRRRRQAIEAEDTDVDTMAALDADVAQVRRKAISARGLVRECEATCRRQEALATLELQRVIAQAHSEAGRAAERKLAQAKAQVEAALGTAMPTYLAAMEEARLTHFRRAEPLAGRLIQEGTPAEMPKPSPAEALVTPDHREEEPNP